MRRFGIGLIAAALLLSTSPAMAKDLNKRFGVGGQRNSLGAQGINFKYWIQHIGVGLMLGTSRMTQKCLAEGTSPAARACGGAAGLPDSVKTADRSTTSLDAALRIMFNAARAKDVNMFIGGGFAMGYTSVSPGAAPENDADKDKFEAESSATEFALELVIGSEYFFSNHFSVNAEVGIPVRFGTSDDGAGIAGGGGTLSPGAAGSSFGLGIVNWAGGFTFYF